MYTFCIHIEHIHSAFICRTFTVWIYIQYTLIVCSTWSVSVLSLDLPFFKCQIKTSSRRYATRIVTFLVFICSRPSPICCGFSSRHHLGPVLQYLKIIRINWITEKITNPHITLPIFVKNVALLILFACVLMTCAFSGSPFPQTSVAGGICLSLKNSLNSGRRNGTTVEPQWFH